jgi:parallel beta-helix repeat protein
LCRLNNSGSIVDTVGWGTATTNETANAAKPAEGESIERKSLKGGYAPVQDVYANDSGGIYLYNSDYCTISDNTVSNIGWCGIYLFRSSDCTLSFNNVSNNGGDGICIGLSSNCMLTNNIASYNGGYCINVAYSSDNRIYNNYFENMNNARDDGNNAWNITKTPGMNIIRRTLSWR